MNVALQVLARLDRRVHARPGAWDEEDRALLEGVTFPRAHLGIERT